MDTLNRGISSGGPAATKPFTFDGQEVRVVDRGGEPWFVLADVCAPLEIKNARDAASRLDDDEKNTVAITDGNRGNPNTLIINESGLYSLILTSRKPEAKRFKKWVTSEVLPAIRKTGGYMVAAPEETVEALADCPRCNISARVRKLTYRSIKLPPITWVRAGARGLVSPRS